MRPAVSLFVAEAFCAKLVGFEFKMGANLFGEIICAALLSGHSSTFLALRLENQAHRARETLPLACLVEQFGAALRCEGVEARLAIVFAESPLGLDEFFVFEALQGEIKGAMVDEQNLFGLALNGARYALSVTGSKQKDFQDQYVQGPLE
jgi:hypothetical protein